MAGSTPSSSASWMMAAFDSCCSGAQTRSFCFVDDLVRGLILLAESGEHLPVNIGNPDEITVEQLAREIIELTGAKIKIIRTERPVDDPGRRRPDITKAKTILKWEPKVSRKEGLAKTIEYFRSIIPAK